MYRCIVTFPAVLRVVCFSQRRLFGPLKRIRSEMEAGSPETRVTFLTCKATAGNATRSPKATRRHSNGCHSVVCFRCRNERRPVGHSTIRTVATGDKRWRARLACVTLRGRQRLTAPPSAFSSSLSLFVPLPWILLRLREHRKSKTRHEARARTGGDATRTAKTEASPAMPRGAAEGAERANDARQSRCTSPGIPAPITSGEFN